MCRNNVYFRVLLGAGKKSNVLLRAQILGAVYASSYYPILLRETHA